VKKSTLNKPVFALFGHGYHLCYLVRLLIDQGFPNPVIITHPKEKHERDRGQLKDPDLYEYLFDVADKYDIRVLQIDKVDSQQVSDFLEEHNCDIGFSLSCRSIIKQKTIDFFNGRIFNIHPATLPKERGGAIFSWRILNNIFEVSATIHYIDTGIDTGNIVLQKCKYIERDFPTPADYMAETNSIYKNLLNIFLRNLSTIINNNGNLQNESESTYYPRLVTEINGAIDWSLSGEYIERTIRAFSFPYSGAFTHLNGEIVSIMNSTFEEIDHDMHPLMYGKVINTTKQGPCKVVVSDGYLYVYKIKDAQGVIQDLDDIITFPSQFYTPIELVESAKNKIIKISKL